MSDKTQIRGNNQIKDLSINNNQIATNANIDLSKIANSQELLKRDGSVPLTGDLDADGNKIENLGAPVADNDAVRKVDLDSAVTDLEGQISNSNIDLSALEDRMDIAEGDIVALEGRMDTAESDINSLESADVVIEGRLDLVESKNLEQDGRLDTAEADIVALEGRMDTAEGDIDALEAADIVIDGRLDSLEAEDIALDGRLDVVEAKDLEQDGRLDVVEGDLAQEIIDRAAGDVQVLSDAQDYTDQKITDLVNGAPAVLDTLKELADALGNDENFASTIAGQISDLDGRLDTAETDINQLEIDLAAEEAARIAADSDLQDQIDEATAGVFISREVPVGSINGSNTTFTLANVPNVNSEQVFLNGILQNVGEGNDYTISGSTITFDEAPQSGDLILVNYISDAIVVVTGSGSGVSGSGVSAYAEFGYGYAGSDTVTVASPSVAKVPLNQSIFNEGIVLDTVDSTWTHNATGKYMITLMYRQDSTTWPHSDDLWHQYAVKKDGSSVVGRSVRASSRNAGPAIMYQFIYNVDSTTAEYSINGWVSFGDTKVGVGPNEYANQISALSDSNFTEPGILVNIRKL